MKTGGMAILLFVAAFVITTAALIFLNTQYMNIFKFDFRPVSHAALPVSDSTAVVKADSSIVKSDSAKAVDSLNVIAEGLNQPVDTSSVQKASAVKNQADVKSRPELKNQIQNTPAAITQIANPYPANDAGAGGLKKMDPQTFEKWKKSTAGILEAMDANKASQILRMYADNIGNELLYAMKKKKAAEILSKFDAKKDSLLIRKLTRIQ